MSGVVYFLFMAAWLNVFLLVGLSRVTQLILGIVALGIGLLNVKDFAASHRGPTLSIPERAKPGLYARTRGLLEEKPLLAAMGGVFVLALLVNLVELACTAGLPAVYTQILTMRQLPTWQYYAYLALYNVAYIVDDSAMLVIAVVTLSRRKLQERAGRWLKLLSGTVMLTLGLLLLFWPRALLLLMEKHRRTGHRSILRAAVRPHRGRGLPQLGGEEHDEVIERHHANGLPARVHDGEAAHPLLAHGEGGLLDQVPHPSHHGVGAHRLLDERGGRIAPRGQDTADDVSVRQDADWPPRLVHDDEAAHVLLGHLLRRRLNRLGGQGGGHRFPTEAFE